jgi:uncharacterized Zn finger protein (UPF0148 family)
VSAPVLKSVTTRVSCPHCGREVSWTKTAQQAAEEARMTLARIEGLPVTTLIPAAGGED